MVYLISEKTLKTYSLINDNVDTAFITPSIQIAQEIDLVNVIGSKLYNHIINLVADGSIEEAANVNYKKLLDDYITNYLIYATMKEIQLPLAYKQRNLGVIQTTDTNTITPSLKDVQYLIDYYEDKMDWYGNRLSGYLCKHSQLFPQYSHYTNGDEVGANGKSYNCNLFLD